MFYLGLDLAKLTFSACLMASDKTRLKTKTFKRNEDGLEALVNWVSPAVAKEPVWVVMEATGDLWCVPASTLDQQPNFRISVVNPKTVHHFAKSLLRRHKTDDLDAHLLALFALQMEPRLWTPIAPLRFKLRSLTRRIHQLTKMLSSEKTRLKHDMVKEETQESTERVIAFLKKEKKLL